MDTKRKQIAAKLAKLTPKAKARVLKLAKIKRLKKAIQQELAARATRGMVGGG